VSDVSAPRQARLWLRAHPLVADSVLAVVVAVVALLGGPNPRDGVAVPESSPSSYLVLAVVCVALVFRRRMPIAVWAVTVVAGVLEVWLDGAPDRVLLASMIAIYTVATSRRWRTAVAAAAVTALAFATAYRMAENAPLLTDTTYALLAFGAMACAIGIAVRGQRQVVAAAEERARIAEQTREEEAQRRVTEERLRIARELHDVVAHHIAVINVQAGVARHLLDTDPEQASAALGHVRDSSQVVLTELSTILGLLRTPDEADSRQPAPVLGQVDELVDSMRRAGLEITWSVAGTPALLAPGTDLAAYRLVQESLTNARKHGLGRADLAVRYAEDSVAIDVTNPVAPGTEMAESGHGLVGMRERVAALGGTLEVGMNEHDRFFVHAELPTATAGITS
jgi:signal transduction histidine kinase